MYTVFVFLTTSSLLDHPLVRQSVFQDDIAHGLYDFEPRDRVDELLLAQLHTDAYSTSKYLGYQDHRHTAPTASWCHRINIDKGNSIHISYDGDGISRRYLRKNHGKLPGHCTGFTVPMGEDYSANPIWVVNDARSMYGQSYLHCEDPRLWESRDPTDQTQNNTEFRFRATYIIAQQHFASALIAFETQTSYCKAIKINTTDFWRVEPAIEGDTKAYLNVLFTNKSRLLSYLDVVGQIVVALVIVKTLLTAIAHAEIIIPTQSRTYYQLALDWVKGGNPAYEQHPRINAGGSRFKLSNAWLANPIYIVASGMYALGTSTESQMIVEVLYWQYCQSHDSTDIIYAGIYATRHAWVSVAIWSVIRNLLGFPRIPILPKCVREHILGVETYCSSRLLVITFLMSSATATLTRGVIYLLDVVDLTDVASGIPKGSFWQSEVFQSLAVNHAFALLYSYATATCNKLMCRKLCPSHRRNSFLRALDSNRRFSGFDMLEFLQTAQADTMHGQTILILRLSEFYQAYASVNVLAPTAVQMDTDVAFDDVLVASTQENGRVLCFSKSGVKVESKSALHAIQQSMQNDNPHRLICVM
ncbi:TPA: hypothetical protein N0F65_003025 [Lagenidium giganteum]|uniref:Uncharacterized protein n=1 Tax=Lagenidium giganteum TaxID=4803 RepID=A0AAV2YVV6_9STRA|nr:TPA: hypothetical protein N0F65_003025 [Lagenidium giganteum]